MSMRANIVTVRDGIVCIKGSGWGATDGTVLMLLEGGESAIANLGDLWTETDSIYDSIMGEAGALIDFDEKQIVCYSDHEPMGETARDDQLQSVTESKIVAAWPGWDVNRADWMEFARAVEKRIPEAVPWD